MRALELDRHPHVLRFGRQVGQTESQSHRLRTWRSRRADRRRCLSTSTSSRHRRQEFWDESRHRETAHRPRCTARPKPSAHPQCDDVATRDQHVRRIVIFQFGRLLRPTERRMRPECGAEPGVENVACHCSKPKRWSADPRLGSPVVRSPDTHGSPHIEFCPLFSRRVDRIVLPDVKQHRSGFHLRFFNCEKMPSRVKSSAGLLVQTGMRCPHHSCRLTGQSRFSPSQSK